MKRFLSLAIALCACAFTASAQSVAPSSPAVITVPAATPAALPEAPSWSYTVTPGFVSQYMFRGQLISGPSFDPSVEADYGNYALGLWGTAPFTKVEGQPELDVYGSYSHSFNDSLSIQPGFTLYTYANAPTDQGFYKATFEPSLALPYTVDGITLTPKVYYDITLRGPTEELTAAYTQPLTPAIPTELDFTATVGTYRLDSFTNTSPEVRAWGEYWLVGVSAPFTIGKGKLSVGFAYTKGTDAFLKQGDTAKVRNSTAVGRGVVSVGYAISF